MREKSVYIGIKKQLCVVCILRIINTSLTGDYKIKTGNKSEINTTIKKVFDDAGVYVLCNPEIMWKPQQSTSLEMIHDDVEQKY